MKDNFSIDKKFSYLGKELLDRIEAVSKIKTFAPQTQLVKEGQYVKFIPIVLDGLVKVYTPFEDKELLLYYIQPEQSCIMSFSSTINNAESNIVAITVKESTVLLIPSRYIAKWLIEFPALNKLFYKQYDLRYNELLETIHQILHFKLDRRVYDYLAEQTQITGLNPIKITHKEIATDLGTAREVVSRIIKKLEVQKLLKQHHDTIEVF